MKSDYVNSREIFFVDPSNELFFLHKGSVYLGVNVLQNIETNASIKEPPDLLDYFYVKCIDSLKTQGYDFKDSIFKYLSFLEPQNALKFRDEHPSLHPFIKHVLNFLQQKLSG